MKKSKKIFIILINLILVLFIISNTVLGSLVDDFAENIVARDTTEIKHQGGKILGIIRIIGTIISVAMLMVIGIKYMMGSAAEKAEYKKTLMPYLIGSILLFTATTIADVIYEFVNGL